jgi:hypothetical protein
MHCSMYIRSHWGAAEEARTAVLSLVGGLREITARCSGNSERQRTRYRTPPIHTFSSKHPPET